MPTIDLETADLDAAIAEFRAGGVAADAGDGLMPRDWSDEDWQRLFGFVTIRAVAAGDALIRRGEADRTLFFVLGGSLEVIVNASDGHSMGPLTRIGAGSVLGEQSFFDGRPRSASAWAVGDCRVGAMSLEQFAAFEEAHPRLARDLLLALGRILATRLRTTTAKVFG